MENRKLAIITGASSGIGMEMAKILVTEYDLVLTARRADRLQALAATLREAVPQAQITCYPCDLSRREECVLLHSEFADAEVEIFINGAGLGALGQFTETGLERELTMIDTNVTAVHILMKLFLQDMVQRSHGYLLNIASSASYMPGSPLMAGYYASKSYVLSLTRSVAAEPAVKNSGVYVGALCPGPVATEFNQAAGMPEAKGGMSAQACASYAIRKMFARKKVIIPGFFIQFTYLGAKLLPASFLLWFAGKHQEKKIRA